MTNRAKLPGLPRVSTQDQALNRWIAAVAERLEVREGSRGDPGERAVTVKELQTLTRNAVKVVGGELVASGALAGSTDPTTDPNFVARLEEAIRNTRLYQNLLKRLDDPGRFDDLATEVRQALANSIAQEALSRGADIRRVETKIQQSDRSLAMAVEELTAAIGTSAAGIREVKSAFATADRAQAAKVTQLEARLDIPIADADKLPLPPAAPYASLAALKTAVPKGVTGKYYRVAGAEAGDPELLYAWNGKDYLPAGEGTNAKLEEVMKVTADRVTGAESEYSMKVEATAGGVTAVAGFGLSAAVDPSGSKTSAFIVRADKFAVVAPGDTSDTDRYPFGVDANGVYINGSLRVNSSATLDDVTSRTYADYIFKRSATALTTAPTQPVVNGVTDLQAIPTGWSDAPPTGTDPLYMSKGTRKADGSLVGAWSVPVNMEGKDGKEGKYTEYQYAVNSSATVAPTSGWQASPPSVSSGQFLWMQSRVVDPAAALPAWGTAVRVSGEKGDQGIQGIAGTPGANGATYYTWVKYADSPTSGMSDYPSGKAYLGIAYNQTTPVESTNYGDYNWSLIKGTDGQPGTNGADGVTYYTWIKYADNASGSGMSDSPTGKTYVGLAVNKTTATESTNAADYTWSLIQGPQGPQGPQGSPGAQGTRGAAFATSTAESPSDSAFTTASGLSPAIEGDQLMLTNSSGSTIYTRRSGSWTNSTALQVHGNAVITGTLSATTLATDKVIIKPIGSRSGSLTVTNGVGTVAFTTSSVVSTPLWSYAVDPPAGVHVSVLWYYNTSTTVWFQVHATNFSGGPYSGTIGTVKIWMF